MEKRDLSPLSDYEYIPSPSECGSCDSDNYSVSSEDTFPNLHWPQTNTEDNKKKTAGKRTHSKRTSDCTESFSCKRKCDESFNSYHINELEFMQPCKKGDYQKLEHCAEDAENELQRLSDEVKDGVQSLPDKTQDVSSECRTDSPAAQVHSRRRRKCTPVKLSTYTASQSYNHQNEMMVTKLEPVSAPRVVPIKIMLRTTSRPDCPRVAEIVRSPEPKLPCAQYDVYDKRTRSPSPLRRSPRF